MPTLRIEGYKFRFFSSDWHEPPHMHVLRGERRAKLWLNPVDVAYTHGYNQSELNHVLKLTHRYRAQLLEAWYAYFARQ